MYIDLTEAFSWVGAYDLTFGPSEDLGNLNACHVALRSDDEKRSAKLVIVKLSNHYYKIGELIVTGVDPLDGLDIEDVRHPISFSQEFKIPAAMPKDQYFLGPMNEINMVRVIRLVQSTLRNDDEMRDYTLFTLGLSFPTYAEELAAKKPCGQESKILVFPSRGLKLNVS